MKPTLKLVEDTGSQLEPDVFDPPPQQAEMPFAIVDGEPVTQMPKDLYIPPDALQVILEAFEGPLDLLLYLIRRQNLDILDIPIAEITRQYMQYIEVMAEMQLELAGEYLLMAAMLAEIKSRMLLPRPPAAEGQEEEDPRAELVRRLQEYERFKQAAEDLDQLPRLERDTMVASVELVERKVVRVQPQVSLQEMLLAFRDVLQRADMFAHHQVQREALSIRQRMSDILSTLRDAAFLDFVRLFKAEEGRMGVTVTFIAILQLMKDGLIEIVQAEPYAPLHVRPASAARNLSVVGENDGAMTSADADAENQAALAQPAYPDEDEDYVEPEVEFAADETEEAAAPVSSSESSEESSADEAPSEPSTEEFSDETAFLESSTEEPSTEAAPSDDAMALASDAVASETAEEARDFAELEESTETIEPAETEVSAVTEELTGTDEPAEAESLQTIASEDADPVAVDAIDEASADADAETLSPMPPESSADDSVTPAGEDDETTGQAQ